MRPWELKPAEDLGLPGQERWRSPRRESGLVETATHLLWWGLVRAYLAGYHRLTVYAREHLPARPPFVLVANHASHLDALAVAAPLPWRWRDHIFPIAAGDTFFTTPVASAFAAYGLNALPLWRRQAGPHALQTLRERLQSGSCAYLLFPEGTRSRNGVMARFKPGLGMLVAGSPVPVVPCHLLGTFDSLPPHRKFPRPVKITLRFGKPLAFAETSQDREGWNIISGTLEEAVRALRVT